jgi:hypothetical protein
VLDPPKDRAGVLPNRLVGCNECQRLYKSLSHKHAIEWVLVVRGKAGSGQRVLGLNGQKLRTEAFRRRPDQNTGSRGQHEFAQCVLDADFPDAGDGHEQFITCVCEGCCRRVTQSLWLSEHPEPDMGIEQVLHSSSPSPSKYFWISGGRGSLKSPGTAN